MNKLLTAFGLAVLFTMNSAAKVVLPDIISDNMVIQQNTKVRLWVGEMLIQQLVL